MKKNINHNEVLSCSVERNINNLKRSGNTDFKPLLFLQVIETTLKMVGNQLHEKTVYNLEKLYKEVMYKQSTVCNTPSSLSFIYGKNQCDSPIYIPQLINNGPVITDPQPIVLDDL